jgi:hypothetical protein
MQVSILGAPHKCIYCGTTDIQDMVWVDTEEDFGWSCKKCKEKKDENSERRSTEVSETG